MASYSEMVRVTREHCPDALIVLVGPYWNLQYDAETWSQPRHQGRFKKFGLPGDDLVLSYNEAISKLAEQSEQYSLTFIIILRGLLGC